MGTNGGETAAVLILSEPAMHAVECDAVLAHIATPLTPKRMDSDLHSIQEARTLLDKCTEAQRLFAEFDQDAVNRIVVEMGKAGVKASERLAKLAHEETGFGRIESKVQKNLFATKTLLERMEGMKTCGVIRKIEDDSIWEIATPMGVVAALIPSTNPTSTAMYKAIIAAKARCGLVVSPHPRAIQCTAEALRVVSEAAYKAGAPVGLFGCLSAVTIEGTNTLLEDGRTDLILATGGSAMVRAAYSKGKPAYGVGSGNVPAYVDRSADLEKASKDLVYGASFDYGTLCSTERSIVADLPIREKLLHRLTDAGAHILSASEIELLRAFVWKNDRLNVEQVGKSPAVIARGAGFSVPPETKVLVAEVNHVGRTEPLSAETLSPILSFYTVDGWEAGCERCKEILAFGGIGHTLGLHCGNDRIIEAFALEKPAMRIVVNTVCALGAVGYTNRLFPAMTLGPGTMGGSITSDNISPMHLINIKRLAFETSPIHPIIAGASAKGRSAKSTKRHGENSPRSRLNPQRIAGGPNEGSNRSLDSSPWMREIEARLLSRAGNPRVERPSASTDEKAVESTQPAKNSRPEGSPSENKSPHGAANKPSAGSNVKDVSSLSDRQIDELIARFRKI